VLFIVCGLLREYQAGIEGLGRQIVASNPHTLFDLALLTSERLLCSYRDAIQNRAVRGVLALGGHVNESIVSLLKPWGIKYVFQELSDSPIPGSDCHYVRNSAACFMKGMPPGLTVPPLHPKPSFQFRLAHGVHQMASRGLLKQYDHIVVIRPDSVLSRPLNLRRECPTHTGFNIISGSIERDFGQFHNRDFDLAYLACEPTSLQTWLIPWLDNNASNRRGKRQPPPRLPAAFRSNLTTDQCKPYYGPLRYECVAVAKFEDSGQRLGTLDDKQIFVHLVNHETWTRENLVPDFLARRPPPPPPPPGPRVGNASDSGPQHSHVRHTIHADRCNIDSQGRYYSL
jgi:hypothetical protein